MESNPYLGTVEYDIPEMAGVPAEAFEQEVSEQPHPGEITARQDGARLIPVSPAACPAHAAMQHLGVEPECENRTEGRCCTEFVGATGRGTVVCAALHPDRALQAANQEPLVALVALQKREKLPPPLH